MSTHTPGPWTIDHEGNVIVEGDGRATLAWVSSPDSYENGDEPMMANARLIAAAPDLLDLAHNVGGLDDHVVTYGDIRTLRDLIIEWRDAARAAIAKAEGVS